MSNNHSLFYIWMKHWDKLVGLFLNQSFVSLFFTHVTGQLLEIFLFSQHFSPSWCSAGRVLCASLLRRGVYVTSERRSFLQTLTFLDFIFFVKSEFPESVEQKKGWSKSWKDTDMPGGSQSFTPWPNNSPLFPPYTHEISWVTSFKPLLHGLEFENHCSGSVIPQIFWVGEQMRMVGRKLKNFRYRLLCFSFACTGDEGYHGVTGDWNFFSLGVEKNAYSSHPK